MESEGIDEDYDDYDTDDEDIEDPRRPVTKITPFASGFTPYLGKKSSELAYYLGPDSAQDISNFFFYAGADAFEKHKDTLARQNGEFYQPDKDAYNAEKGRESARLIAQENLAAFVGYVQHTGGRDQAFAPIKDFPAARHRVIDQKKTKDALSARFNRFFPNEDDTDYVYKHWGVRFGAGALFLMSWIAVLIATLTHDFDVRTRYTTSFITNGLTPTPGNGLLNVVGTGEWAWWILASFAFSWIVHWITLGVVPKAVQIREGTAGHWWLGGSLFDHFLVRGFQIGHDPTLFLLFVVGWGVIGTVVAQAVGVTDILFLIAIFALIAIFGWQFVASPGRQFSRNVYAYGGAIPYATNYWIDNKGEYQVYFQNLRGNVVETRSGHLIGTPDGAARNPMWLAYQISKLLSSYRYIIGWPVKLAEKYNRSDAVAGKFRRDLNRYRSNYPEGVPNSIASNGTRVRNSGVYLAEDIVATIIDVATVFMGWLVLAVITAIFGSFFWGAWHQTHGTFEWWAWVAFFMFMAMIWAIAITHSMYWFSKTKWWINLRIYDLSLWHIGVSTVMQIAVGFILLAGPNNTGVIY